MHAYQTARGDRRVWRSACPRILLLLGLTLLGLSPDSLGAQAAASAGGVDGDLDAARNALYRHEHAEAERVLKAVIASSPSAEDAAEAHRRLATLAWRIQAKPEVGRAHLRRALALSEGRSQSFRELARLERHAGDLGAAHGAADSALAHAESNRDSVDALVEMSRAAVADARARAAAGSWIGGKLESRLRRVRTGLQRSVTANPGLLDPAEQLVLAGLLTDDGAAALAGWRSYFASVGGQAGPVPAARVTLEGVLPTWRGPRTPAAARRAAIAAMGSSGMLEAARLLALDQRLPTGADPTDDPAIADLVAYADFLDRVGQRAAAYYRDVAAGTAEQWVFRDDVVDLGRRLVRSLTWADGPPELSEDPWGGEAWAALGERFGTEVRFGNTAGVFGLRIGHRIVDERRTVEQYGRSATVRFVALDRMAVDDYQTWSWDGTAVTGGYANPDLIVQLREGYAGGGIRAWDALTDPEPDTAIGSPTGGPCSYVAGLDRHLRHQGLEQLRDSLRAEGHEGAELRAAFLAAYDRIINEISIFAHEGRHSIDGGLGITESEELEFRAKLSQVVFAPIPRLAIGSVLSRGIGSPTPHGQANERAVCGLLAWMEEHADQIQGLDPGRPLLPQLPLLTDSQIREAFRAQDPMATPAGAV